MLKILLVLICIISCSNHIVCISQYCHFFYGDNTSLVLIMASTKTWNYYPLLLIIRYFDHIAIIIVCLWRWTDACPTAQKGGNDMEDKDDHSLRLGVTIFSETQSEGVEGCRCIVVSSVLEAISVSAGFVLQEKRNINGTKGRKVYQELKLTYSVLKFTMQYVIPSCQINNLSPAWQYDDCIFSFPTVLLHS